MSVTTERHAHHLGSRNQKFKQIQPLCGIRITIVREKDILQRPINFSGVLNNVVLKKRIFKKARILVEKNCRSKLIGQQALV